MSACGKMEDCINDIRKWMANSFLKLNDNKTEVLLIGSKHSLKKLPKVAVQIGNDMIIPSNTARNIGAMFDSTLSMKYHVASICKGAWYHLRSIGQVRNCLDVSSAKILMHSFVSSRLDNLNSLLYGIPKQEIMKLQRIQNAAARIVSKAKKYDHITPTLHALHWLPISQRIQYKILLLTYKALNNLAPQYIADMLKPIQLPHGRSLRSEYEQFLFLPSTNLVTFGGRSFSHAAPKLWNKLPSDCRKARTLGIFKSLLKTHLFREAFG